MAHLPPKGAFRNGADDTDPVEFQNSAMMADAGVTAIIGRALETGADPAAVASGALFAVVRLHAQFLGINPTESNLLQVMAPAIARIARELRGN